MKASEIQKYRNKTIRQLIDKAVKVVHAYVRERDKDKPCISCGIYTALEAGHFYSGGHYSALKFNYDNIHGQCGRCNRHLSGNLNEYRKRIVERIGPERLAVLDRTADQYKRMNFKWDRFSLIDIIIDAQKIRK